jgi:hypothetical protein
VADAPPVQYAMTILTDGNTDEASGIDLVEAVARHVDDLGLLRRINGGEAVPVRGQRVCAP